MRETETETKTKTQRGYLSNTTYTTLWLVVRVWLQVRKMSHATQGCPPSEKPPTERVRQACVCVLCERRTLLPKRVMCGTQRPKWQHDVRVMSRLKIYSREQRAAHTQRVNAARDRPRANSNDNARKHTTTSWKSTMSHPRGVSSLYAFFTCWKYIKTEIRLKYQYLSEFNQYFTNYVCFKSFT